MPWNCCGTWAARRDLEKGYQVRKGRLCCALLVFSSRIRHTSLQGDWSSDVCSSDLLLPFSSFQRLVVLVGTGWPMNPWIGSRRVTITITSALVKSSEYRMLWISELWYVGLLEPTNKSLVSSATSCNA